MKKRNVVRGGRAARGRGGRFSRQSSSVGASFSDASKNVQIIPDPTLVKRETRVRFIFLNSETKEYLVPTPESYWDLQQIIAKYQRGQKKMFTILNSDKEFVTSENYTPSEKFTVKEFFSQVPNSRYPLVPVLWDYSIYHAKPSGWRDPALVRAEKLKLEEERKTREQQEEERLIREFLSNPAPKSLLDDYDPDES
jgi:hypothetical protein